MKRKVEERRRFRMHAYDVRDEISREQLAALGACALVWNDVEAMLDVLLCVVMRIHHAVWRELTTRINGIDGKIGLIKHAMKTRFGFGEDAFDGALTDTLAAVAQYRGYRDTCIHARIIDPFQGVGEMAIRRGKIEEVLLTDAALWRLYEHMLALKNELYELITFFEALEGLRALTKDGEPVEHLATELMLARYQAMAEGKPGVISAEDFSKTSDKQALEQEAQDAQARYQHHRCQRLELPPLPSLPAPLSAHEVMARILAEVIPVPKPPDEPQARE